MSFAKFDLTGRVAIVTGGGTGIGAAIARLLARRGADIALAGRRVPPLEATAAAIREETGRRVTTIPTDVRKAAECAAMVERAVAKFGRLDVLINNAGKGTLMPLKSMPPEVWDKDVALNLSAAFYCSQAAFPHMVAAGKGAIVNISSLAGVHGTVGHGAYSAAKAGLQQLTRVSSAEFGPRGVRVNCVAPGMIATELAREGWEKRGFDAMAACQGFPLRRYGEVDEIAEAVAFFASDAASYITGEILAVGGGPQLKGMIDPNA